MSPQKKTQSESRFNNLFKSVRSSERPTGSQSDDETPKQTEEPLAKSKDAEYQRTTLYLPKTLHRKLKTASIEDGRDMSDIVAKLIEDWLDRRGI
ncbi:hypothetical protein [Baaleninema simplex]|uniref:hypothetical protein n=1 Tax=Baaleninema simplex TaxID=2862350 RepID=UPI000349E5F7|nr:hypothetical protein [Baaleninema simplex]